MNMVSSPDRVPMTSGHRAVSMATATLCAAPTVVFSTVRFVPAVKRALTNCLRVEKSFLGAAGLSGSTYRSPILATPSSRRSRLTLDWVATCPCMRSIATSSVWRPTACSRMFFASVERRAGALVLSSSISERSIESDRVHKVARMLHKNARIVNAKFNKPIQAPSSSGIEQGRRIAQGQAEQGPVVGAAQGLVQPTAKLPAVDLSLLHFGEHDSADQYLAAGHGLALAQRLDGALARIEALLTELQLGEFLLQCRNLVIEFGHGVVLWSRCAAKSSDASRAPSTHPHVFGIDFGIRPRVESGRWIIFIHLYVKEQLGHLSFDGKSHLAGAGTE